MEIAQLKKESKEEGEEEGEEEEEGGIDISTKEYPNFSPSDIIFDTLQNALKTNRIPVYKYGMVTGLTVGILGSVDSIVAPVESCRDENIPVVSVSWLKSVFPEMAFTRPGDSGSLYYIDWRALSIFNDSILPLAIHVEASGHHSIGTRIDKAMKQSLQFCGSSCDGQSPVEDIFNNKLLYYITLKHQL